MDIFRSGNTEIIEDNGTNVKVEGVKAGKAFIKVESPGETKRLSKVISVTVKQSPLRILAIGNSFRRMQSSNICMNC